MKQQPMSEPKIRIGWREWVSLPELGIERIKAKIDSGARTSAIHASFIHITSKSSKKKIVEFIIHPEQDSAKLEISAKAKMSDHRLVKSSIGHGTVRPVIETTLIMGKQKIPIELTLVNRDLMGFRMLIGRQALRKKFVIDPGSSFLLNKKNKP